MTRVLLTGGAGYIGSHTCKALAESGYIPVCFDNLSTGNKWAVKWGSFELGDIRDFERIYSVIKKYEPVAIIHFAASAYVGESVLEPEKYYENNVYGSLALLKAMLQCSVKNFIFSSTCATYGIPVSLPINESHPQNPINPYGASKLFVERILKDFNAAYGLRSTILRYFNAAGADPDGEIGECHNPETHAIPLLLQSAMDRSESFVVNGNDYDTTDGTCVRDYVHVCDLASAHVAAVEHTIRHSGVEAYNLGTGNGCSVKELIQSVCDVTGKNVGYRIGPRRAGDPSTLVADPTFANTALGWSPQYKAINTIIEHAWHWHKKSQLLVNG